MPHLVRLLAATCVLAFLTAALGCSDAGKKIVVPPPIAEFDATPTEGGAPLVVQFQDLSQRAVAWEWDFNNDGIVDSTEQHPSHTFLANGPPTR